MKAETLNIYSNDLSENRNIFAAIPKPNCYRFNIREHKFFVRRGNSGYWTVSEYSTGCRLSGDSYHSRGKAIEGTARVLERLGDGFQKRIRQFLALHNVVNSEPE